MEKEDLLKNRHQGHHRLRTGRFSMRGLLYHITICVDNREHKLDRTEIAGIIFDSLEYLNEKSLVRMVCCIIMPDHIHIVFQLGEVEIIDRVIQSFKRHTGNRINKYMGRTGKFWQRQFYDHIIRKEESLTNIIQYCMDNPVRKGIVGNPEDYPFWKLWEENLKYVI